MTITAVPSNQMDAFGYVQLEIPTEMGTQTQAFFPMIDINADLETLSPYYAGTDGGWWRIYWYLSAYIPNATSNAGKFKSALPKQDLATIVYTFMGQAVADLFINYSAQRLNVCMCWNELGEFYFPTDFQAPYPIGNAQLYPLFSSYNGATNFLYADAFNLQLTNGEQDGMNLTVYYAASYAPINGNVSFSFI